MQNTLNKSQDRLEKVKKFVNFVLDSNTLHPLLSYACSELGINFNELIPQVSESLTGNNPQQKQFNDFLHSHHEARRKAKINLVSNFILEHKLKPNSATNFKPRHLSPDTSRMQPESTYLDEKDRKVKNLKKTIFYQLTVEENLKKLQQKEENDKKQIETRIKQKESREIVKHINKKLFEIRDQRIKAKLEKKKKDLEAQELKGLSYKPLTKDKPEHNSSFTPTLYTKATNSQSPDNSLNISEALERINNKLNNSATRAQELLLAKKLPAQQFSTQFNRVKTLREHLLIKQESEKLQILQKLQRDQEFSSQRRLILSEQKKLTRSLNQSSNKVKKKGQAKLKSEESDEIEYKNGIIEKARKDVRELYEQRSQVISMKSAIRKNDQEENLRRIESQKWKDKDKLIERIRDLDCVGKGKVEIDVKAIRAQVKREFKKNKFMV